MAITRLTIEAILEYKMNKLNWMTVSCYYWKCRIGPTSITTVLWFSINDVLTALYIGIKFLCKMIIVRQDVWLNSVMYRCIEFQLTL